MITAREIRHALTKVIQTNAKLPYKVFFEHVSKSGESYVFVDLMPKKTTIDKVYFQWNINVDINVVLIPDEYALVQKEDLWDISDRLMAAIMPTVIIETEDGDKSKTRYATVQDFNSYIVDDILHHEFVLDFTDYVRSDEYEGLDYEFMQDLEIQFDDWKMRD